MARPAQAASAVPAGQEQHYAVERRRQAWVLWAVALLALVIAVATAGVHSVFLPGWWRVDVP